MSTYVNPRPEPVRLVLSDGSERRVGAWGLALLPDSLDVVRAEFDAQDTELGTRLKRRANQPKAA